GIKVVLIEPGPITSDIRKNAIPHFERWIDWKSSARADEYAGLLSRLYTSSGPDRFGLPASAVTARLLTALTVPHPKPRYYVTRPTYLAGIMRRVLPTRLLDVALSRG
ncbi:MAG: short-chain dehydrogenase, partial [Loktanella sp.]|nr:short-chain dehydrogenase [Loktanella sp.]